MNEELNHTLEIYNTNRYELISENIMKVDSNEVIKKVRHNRVLFTCTCENAEKTDNQGFCRHKFFFLMFPYFERLDSKIWSYISYYKTMKSVTKSPEEKRIYEIFLDHLEEIRRVKL